MRSQHRAPLVAYAIVAIVGLVVIMQTVSPDVMALQRVPRSLVGHGAYRVEDPPAPIAPQPLVPSGSSTPSTSSSSGGTSGGESRAEPGSTTTPVAQHRPPRGGVGSQGGVPQAPPGTTPPGQTPVPAPLPEPTYLLPPIGPLPGVPAPPLVSDLVDALLPDATPATTTAAGKARQGQGKNGSGGGAKVATKTGDQTGSGQAGKQSGDPQQDEQPALRTPVRTLAALAGPAKAAAGRAGLDDGCPGQGKSASKDAGKDKAPVATLGNVLEGAGISPAPDGDGAGEPAGDPATDPAGDAAGDPATDTAGDRAADPSAPPSSAAGVGGKGAACDDGCSSAAGVQRKQAAQDAAGTGTCASAEAQQDHSEANAHHAGK